MPASQLYQTFIVNSTYNVNAIRPYRAAAQALTPQDFRLRPETVVRPQRDFTQQLQIDAAMWYGAINTGPFSDVITKLFHLFYYGGVIYRFQNSWLDWHDCPFGNVASLLSHGQRVMVQIPTLARGGGALWPWLNAVDQIPVRGYATHGLSLKGTPSDLANGHRQYLTEEHGAWQSLKGHAQGRHFGFNPALGGVGNRNPFSRANDDQNMTYVPIAGDGLNGHVYVNYLPPTNTQVGGLLVGCENAEHGRGTNPHTAAGHGLGERMKISACGGKKWSELRCGPQAEYSGLICDLTDFGPTLDWLLNRNLFNPDRLDAKTVPLARIPRP